MSTLDLKSQTAIEFSNGDVLVSRVKATKNGLLVEHSERLSLPGRREGDEREAGKALRSVLNEAGLGCKRAVLVLPRAAVLMRPVEIPGAVWDSDDLADIVRLRFERRATVAAEHELILDFIPPLEGEESVLAAAVRRSELDVGLARLKAAGIRCDGCAVRGAALAALGSDEKGLELLVSVTPSGADLALLKDGRLVHAGVVAGRTPGAVGEAVAVEVDRVLMQPWFGSGRAGLDRARMFGGQREIAEAASRRLGVEFELGFPELIVETEGESDRADVSGVGISHAAALINSSGDGFDFLHPRQAPDTQGARRRVTMLAALLGMGVLAAGWFLIDHDLSALRRESGALGSQARELTAEHRQHLRETARVGHLDRLMPSESVVSDVLSELHGHLPGPGPILIDQIRWTQEAQVDFRAASVGQGAARRRAFTGGNWIVSDDQRLTLSAATGRREDMLGVRESLLASGRYDLRTRAADVDDRLELDLRILDHDRGGE